MEKVIVENELSRIAPVKWMEGINGYSVSFPPEFCGSKTAYGCTLAHLNCLDDIKKNNLKKALIFEDDIILHKDFSLLFKDIPMNCELLYIGAFQRNWKDITIETPYYKAKHTLGGFAYVIDSALIERVKAVYKQQMRPIDELFLQIHSEYNCYVMYPNLCIADINVSHCKHRRFNLNDMAPMLKWNLIDYHI